MTPSDYVYVASSWRNPMYPVVVNTLRYAGVDLYDFRNPPNRTGFSWQQVMPSFDPATQLAPVEDYLEALGHPVAQAGFDSDFDALQAADRVLLVLPCGRSAHLEAGWAIGAGKRVAILLYPDLDQDGTSVTPELMYKMAELVTPSLLDVLGWLGVDD